MRLTPESILGAYRQGAFPMADPATGAVSWYRPEPRAILPTDGWHLPRRLKRSVRKFELTSDRDFEGVIDGCAARPASWISPELRAAYLALHRAGHAHSVEARAEGKLVGGIYGVAIGAAFMAESMFHRATDAGKAALVGLLQHLSARGFHFCDIQMVTPATVQFQPIQIPNTAYIRLLEGAVDLDRPWGTFGVASSPSV